MGALFLKSFRPRISVQVVSYHREKIVVLKAWGVDSKTSVSGSQLCQLVGKLFKCWDSVFSSVKQEVWKDLRHMVKLWAVTSTEKYSANTTVITAITDPCHLREPGRLNFFKTGKKYWKNKLPLTNCLSAYFFSLYCWQREKENWKLPTHDFPDALLLFTRGCLFKAEIKTAEIQGCVKYKNQYILISEPNLNCWHLKYFGDRSHNNFKKAFPRESSQAKSFICNIIAEGSKRAQSSGMW